MPPSVRVRPRVRARARAVTGTGRGGGKGTPKGNAEGSAEGNTEGNTERTAQEPGGQSERAAGWRLLGSRAVGPVGVGRGCVRVRGSLVSCPMAHNPQAPQGPEGHPDPAGSTQMFRAFVDEGTPQQRRPVAEPPAGPRVGVIVGVVVAIVVLAGVAWLAFG